MALGLVLAGALLASCPCVFALDPALDVNQYAHTAWKVRDGFTKGAIFAIAQTPDGYLWLGTESGLVRFDGVRPTTWQPPSGQRLPSNFINLLLVARDGTLWIGTNKGLASWKEDKFSLYREVGDSAITALIEDHEGTVWIGTKENSGGNLCAARTGTLECYRTASFGRGVTSLYEDHKGSLWISSLNGLWRWRPGTPERYADSGGANAAECLVEDDTGAFLLCTSKGLKQLVARRIDSYALPGIAGEFTPTRSLRSSDGSLWLGSYQGLLHVHQGRTDVFKAVDGLSADFVVPIFEDREGSVWVGTQDGLDRFRDVTVPTISRKQGLSNPAAWSVLATRDRSIWIVTADGLNRWENGRVTLYRSQKALGQSGQKLEQAPGVGRTATEIVNAGLVGNPQSLGQDERGRVWASTSVGVFYFEGGRFIRFPGVPGGFTFSVVGDDEGNVWISNSEAGLFHVTPDLLVERIPWSQFRQKDALAVLPDHSQAGLWLGFRDGGVAYFKDGQVRASYGPGKGLGNGEVSDLLFDSRGTLWAATEGGLSRIKDGHIATLTSKNGLPCDAVNWLMQDDDNAFWLSKPCGLVRVARSELDGWVNDPTRAVQFTTLGAADGVRTYEIPGGFPPTVTKSADGRIWFLARDGVSVIDPRHLPYNKVPPPVHIEQITADGKKYEASSGLRLPPLVHDLTIDYTALSLAVPEKVHFRFKLEGQDRDWREVVNEREVQYSNLAPKKYRFRVTASNNSGVWNEEGASLGFSIAPAYYQTTWFRLSCVAAFLALLWALHRLRLRQLQREFEAGLEGRVGERTRIARELHDTLLQSFQGLLLHLQAVSNMLPARPQDAQQKLDSSIDLASQAITEGRQAVQDLRSSTKVTNDIALAVDTFGQELAGNEMHENSPAFRVDVEGTPRDLHPIMRDEVCRIACEALRNAFKHAQASRIEVEIHYDPSALRLRIRDDGKGIEPKLIDGKLGHWGLSGMRERAKLIGGNLELWSDAQTGTEIELTIPAAAAYAKSTAQRRAWFSKRGAHVN